MNDEPATAVAAICAPDERSINVRTQQRSRSRWHHRPWRTRGGKGNLSGALRSWVQPQAGRISTTPLRRHLGSGNVGGVCARQRGRDARARGQRTAGGTLEERGESAHLGRGARARSPGCRADRRLVVESGNPLFASVEAVNGYVNIAFDDSVVASALVREVLQRGPDYGRARQSPRR